MDNMGRRTVKAVRPAKRVNPATSDQKQPAPAVTVAGSGGGGASRRKSGRRANRHNKRRVKSIWPGDSTSDAPALSYQKKPPPAASGAAFAGNGCVNRHTLPTAASKNTNVDHHTKLTATENTNTGTNTGMQTGVPDVVLYDASDAAVELLFSHYQSKVANDVTQTSAQAIKMTLVKHVEQLTKLLGSTESEAVPKSALEDIVAATSAALDHPVVILEQALKSQQASQDDMNFLIPTYFCNEIKHDQGGSVQTLCQEMETIHMEAYCRTKPSASANTKKANSKGAKSLPKALSHHAHSKEENTKPKHKKGEGGHRASGAIKPSLRLGDETKGSSPLTNKRSFRSPVGLKKKSLSVETGSTIKVSKGVNFSFVNLYSGRFFGSIPSGRETSKTNLSATNEGYNSPGGDSYFSL